MANPTVGLVLAGGRVDELSVLTAKRPKSAVPIWGMYRFIDFALSNMMHSGVDAVGVLSQYRPHSLNAHLAGGAPWDFVGRTRELRVLSPYRGAKDSDWYRGTADAVWQNLAFVRDHRTELVLIVSGDHIYSMDYRPMIRRHLENRADLTIAFTRVPPEQASRFGTATLDETGRLTRYQEKAAKPDSDLASMTVYAFNVDVLTRRLAENMKSGRTFQIYDEVIPRMVAEGDRVFGHVFEGPWRYARTIDAYYEASLSILGADAPDLDAWEVRTNLGTARASDRPPAAFRPGARVAGSLVAPGARIAGTVERSVISAGVVVERGAAVRDSVVMHDCRVAAGAVLDRVILDKEVSVGAEAHLGIGEARPNRKAAHTLTCGAVVVGKGTRIPAGARVGRNCIVPPDLGEGDWPRRPVRSGTTVKP